MIAKAVVCDDGIRKRKESSRRCLVQILAIFFLGYSIAASQSYYKSPLNLLHHKLLMNSKNEYLAIELTRAIAPWVCSSDGCIDHYKHKVSCKIGNQQRTIKAKFLFVSCADQLYSCHRILFSIFQEILLSVLTLFMEMISLIL